MTSSRLPAHLLYPAVIGVAVFALLSALFLFQSRWVSGLIIDASTAQYTGSLQRTLLDDSRRELESLAGRAGSIDEMLAIARRDMPALIAIDFTPAASTEASAPVAEWLSENELLLEVPAPAGADGRVSARYRFTQIDPSGYRDQLSSVKSRGTTIIAVAGGLTAFALLVATVVATGMASRRQSLRIRRLRDEAEKLRDADFGNRLPDGQRDELDELASVFNDMRDKLRLTTLSRDYVDSILSSMNDAIIVTSADGLIKRINRATTELLGYDAEELLHTSIDLFVNTKKSGSLVDEPTSGLPREAFFVDRSGAQIPVSFTCSLLEGQEAETGDRIFAAQNITERRKAEKRIRYLARIDPLTKIPNRMQFQHLLQRSIARARRSQQSLCIFYLDLDGFKDINDTFGHLAGDTALETVAERLTAALPDHAVVGRLAGDEFAVIINPAAAGESARQDIQRLARRILDRLAEPYFIQEYEVFLSASMGIAYYPQDASNVIDLIRNADAALYAAKKSGGNVFVEYRAEMNETAVEKLMTRSKLRRAFERDELLVHYQPKYNVTTGQVIGAEALVRWELPERGLILPADFIPVAEESSLILDIGEWVLDKVCEDFRYWQRSVGSPGRVSVNLSLKQLRQRNFCKYITAILRDYEVSPTSLELEITETTLMENPERTIRLLDELYALGLHLAIDDFGTGYSSLSALQQFPISTLKIDKSFVRHATTNADDATIVGTIVQMGQNLNMDVVAEGVESEDQLTFLQGLGCTYAQGLLFGDPMDADSYLDLLLAQAEGTDQYRALFLA